MAPTNVHAVCQLRQLIYYNLDCDSLHNASFLAGRLCAIDPKSTEATHLQGLSYLRLGQFQAAYRCTREQAGKPAHLGCVYVFAQSCLALGRFLEGILALDRSKQLWLNKNNWSKHSENKRSQHPDAAAAYALLGKLWHAHKEPTQAIENYSAALERNPFMWDAFIGLCDLGVQVRLPNIFRITPEMHQGMLSIPNEEPSIFEGSPNANPAQNLARFSSQTASCDPFNTITNRLNVEQRNQSGKSALFEKLNGSTNYQTPVNTNGEVSFGGLDIPAASAAINATEQLSDKGASTKVATEINVEPPLAPLRKPRNFLGTDLGVDAPPRMKTSTWRMKSKAQGDSEDGDQSSIASTLSNMITDRKRTASGQVSQSTSTAQATNDPGAPGARRSARISNLKPQTTKFSAFTGTLGMKDPREMKKVKATGTKGRSTHASTVGRVVSGNRKHGDPMEVDAKELHKPAPTTHSQPSIPKPPITDRVKDVEAIQAVLDLFSKLAGGYFSLSHYRTDAAIHIFNSLSPAQRDTPWVLAHLGRAYYEKTAWNDAAACFSRLRTIAPARLEDMEIYSSVLWKLKSEKSDIDLAHLAHELIDQDRLSPQAWCAVGNSFSTQKEVEPAIKCFKRATQLDPQFAYGYTLQGHEHIENEEYDKALSAYRAAIAAESRHYNAWWGIGKVYEKQGKYDLAEQHYRIAYKINSNHPALIYVIGIVLEKLRRPHQALEAYDKSIEMHPNQSAPRLRKARVLMSLKKYKQALEELILCKDLEPDDANVHFSLAMAYRLLKKKGEAINHYTTALNLDPKVCALASDRLEDQYGHENGEDDANYITDRLH